MWRRGSREARQFDGGDAPHWLVLVGVGQPDQVPVDAFSTLPHDRWP